MTDQARALEARSRLDFTRRTALSGGAAAIVASALTACGKSSENSNADATSYGVMKLKIDTVPLPAPTEVTGSAGQTVIPLKWKANSYDTVYYRVLADIEPEVATSDADADAGRTADGGVALDGVNAMCPSGILRTGKDIEEPFPENVFQERLSGGLKNSYDFNGTQLGRASVIPASASFRPKCGAAPSSTWATIDRSRSAWRSRRRSGAIVCTSGSQ